MAEAEKNHQAFLAAYKRGMNNATSTAFKLWEDLIKKWQDKLKEVDSSLSQMDVFKTIIRDEAFRALSDEKRAFYESLEARFATLAAGKQELHQVVADSLTSYVSDLRDTLEQSPQALQQSTQVLVSTQQQLDVAVKELQRLRRTGGSNNTSTNSNNNITLTEERIDTMTNINHHSHIISNTPSNDNIVVPVAPTTTTSVDDCPVETGTTNDQPHMPSSYYCC